jgi:uncharacterized membrane protein
MPDPGWILSTCATAAATLLAIVGGFVVVRAENQRHLG